MRRLFRRHRRIHHRRIRLQATAYFSLTPSQGASLTTHEPSNPSGLVETPHLSNNMWRLQPLVYKASRRKEPRTTPLAGGIPNDLPITERVALMFSSLGIPSKSYRLPISACRLSPLYQRFLSNMGRSERSSRTHSFATCPITADNRAFGIRMCTARDHVAGLVCGTLVR